MICIPLPTLQRGNRESIEANHDLALGFDRDIFAGSPSLQHLLDTYKPTLSDEEKAFLANETVELCGMLDDHLVTEGKDLPAEAWDYMRDKGFFAMKIPREWGGKGFSTMAVSAVLAKLGAHCPDANATVAVPNSLGPGELLTRLTGSCGAFCASRKQRRGPFVRCRRAARALRHRRAEGLLPAPSRRRRTPRAA